jgi:hypothetical protein
MEKRAREWRSSAVVPQRFYCFWIISGVCMNGEKRRFGFRRTSGDIRIVLGEWQTLDLIRSIFYFVEVTPRYQYDMIGVGFF